MTQCATTPFTNKAQDDWLNYMLNQDIFSNGWAVEISFFQPANDDHIIDEVEAEYDNFLTFIVDFQAKNKS